MKPKGKKTPPSAAAGSEAQMQQQAGFQQQMPFFNPNYMQNAGFQQNQDPFTWMASLSRFMLGGQFPQGNVQNQAPMGPMPQFQNSPFIAQEEDWSDDESEDGEDLPSDPELFGKQQDSQKQEATGKFEQECEEECKVVLQEGMPRRALTHQKTG